MSLNGVTRDQYRWANTTQGASHSPAVVISEPLRDQSYIRTTPSPLNRRQITPINSYHLTSYPPNSTDKTICCLYTTFCICCLAGSMLTPLAIIAYKCPSWSLCPTSTAAKSIYSGGALVTDVASFLIGRELCHISAHATVACSQELDIVNTH